MSLVYRVYSNAGTGGPVDFATIVATASASPYTTGVLAYPADYTFVVRAYDTVSTIEDLNTDCRARLVLDAAGDDVTNRPSSPEDLSAQPIAAGGLRVEWSYLPTPGSTPPTTFKVWAQIGAIDYALTPSGSTPYLAGRVAYSLDLAGLADGTTYTVAVRASNATADDPNTATVTAVADASGPLPVANLTGQPTY